MPNDFVPDPDCVCPNCNDSPEGCEFCEPTERPESYFDDWPGEDVFDPYDDCDPGDMDGDFDSAMESAGFGTDEDYSHYDDYDGDYTDNW